MFGVFGVPGEGPPNTEPEEVRPEVLGLYMSSQTLHRAHFQKYVFIVVFHDCSFTC